MWCGYILWLQEEDNREAGLWLHVVVWLNIVVTGGAQSRSRPERWLHVVVWLHVVWLHVVWSHEVWSHVLWSHVVWLRLGGYAALHTVVTRACSRK